MSIVREESVVALSNIVLANSFLINFDLSLGLLDDLSLSFVVSDKFLLWDINSLSSAFFVVVYDFHGTQLVLLDLFGWEAIDLGSN